MQPPSIVPRLTGTPAVRLGLVGAAPVAVTAARAPLVAEIDAAIAHARQRFAGRPPASIPELAPARQLYRSFGVDPTRVRPSSEALLRRALRGLPWPHISNAVDVGNLLALRFLLPLGLYDAERIEGPVVLRCGSPDEFYVGARKERVGLAGKPVLADAAGPFGNPTADSRRTAVAAGTRALWLVLFAPASVSPDALADHVSHARSAFEMHLAGAEVVTTAGAIVG